jgi:hypothetical protein
MRVCDAWVPPCAVVLVALLERQLTSTNTRLVGMTGPLFHLCHRVIAIKSCDTHLGDSLQAL